jgi:AbiJ N-terminal domain 4
MRRFFSERMGQPQPRVKGALDETVRTALLQLIELRIDDNSFGLKFPVQCPDGHGNSGCDQQALRNNMAGYQVIWPSDARRLDHEEITDIQIFDLLEYAYEHVAQPLPGGYHSYFSHSHHDYDQEAGRKQLEEEVNRLFERNGIAFQLQAGLVERLVPSVLQEILVQTQFNTGDQILNELLSTAREKFLNRDLKVRREALEKLWDAWERLKSLSDPVDKKNSVKILLDRVTTEPNLRDRVEMEARQLTEIGNNFFIRHTEVTKPPIADSYQVDYLFHRLFSFVRMILQANGVAM